MDKPPGYVPAKRGRPPKPAADPPAVPRVRLKPGRKPGCAPTAGSTFGKGRGYGGPAKGASGATGLGGRLTMQASIVLALVKAERVAAMKDNLIIMALESERDGDRISATMGFLRHEDPVQTIQKVSLSANMDEMTDDELRTVIRTAQPPGDGSATTADET